MSEVEDSKETKISDSKPLDESEKKERTTSSSSLDESKKKERTASASSSSFDDGEGEDLDPRVKNELEELNAATDGINHLETELNEAQALFDQSIEDAKTQLKEVHQKLGKCVDKARPYYEALKNAKNARTELHNVSLKYELGQTRHFNAKKEVLAAEKKVDASIDGKLDPALQELLNQVTTEVMDAALALSDAEKEHNIINTDFNKKHSHLQQTYNKLKNDVGRSRPFFELKSNLNKQLEIQKQRLAKIEEGIQISKNAYSHTLLKLQLISDDIHNTRNIKKMGLSEQTSHDSQSSDLKTIREMSVADSETSLNSDDNATWKPGLDDTYSITSNLLQSDDQINRTSSESSFIEHFDESKESDKHLSAGNILLGERRRTASSASRGSNASCTSDLVIQVNDAMKGMQAGVPSPFECITSYSLEYSNRISCSSEDCLDGTKGDNTVN